MRLLWHNPGNLQASSCQLALQNFQHLWILLGRNCRPFRAADVGLIQGAKATDFQAFTKDGPIRNEANISVKAS